MPNSSGYPGNIDNFGTVIDNVDFIEARHINQINDAINKIETELGTNPRGGFSDVKTALAFMDAHTSRTDNPHQVTAEQVGNSQALWNANKIQGRAVSSVAPGNGNVPVWNTTLNHWEPGNAGSTALTQITVELPLVSQSGTTPSLSIQDSSTSQKGAVQLSNNFSGTSQSVAVTEKALFDGLNAVGDRISTITFSMDGGGLTIRTGIKGDLEIPYNCTIDRVTLLADQSGSVIVDIWKNSFANYPPTDQNSITGSSPPTITSAMKSQDSQLTDWNRSITAGDILRFHVDSCTSITRLTVSLKVTKS